MISCKIWLIENSYPCLLSPRVELTWDRYFFIQICNTSLIFWTFFVNLDQITLIKTLIGRWRAKQKRHTQVDEGQCVYAGAFVIELLSGWLKLVSIIFLLNARDVKVDHRSIFSHNLFFFKLYVVKTCLLIWDKNWYASA